MTGLAVREAGAAGAPSVVLLHGVGNNGSMWTDLMAGLPARHCLAPDLPGHGKSRSVAWTSRSETARLVADLIEERCGGTAPAELVAEATAVDGSGGLAEEGAN